MVQSCQRETIDLPSSCPVCSGPRDIESTTAFINHLGTCIHSFSLLALPWNDAKPNDAKPNDEPNFRIQNLDFILKWLAEVPQEPSAVVNLSTDTKKHPVEDVIPDKELEPSASSVADDLYFNPEGGTSSDSRVSHQDSSLPSSKGAASSQSAFANPQSGPMDVADRHSSSTGEGSVTEDIYIAVAGVNESDKIAFIRSCTHEEMPEEGCKVFRRPKVGLANNCCDSIPSSAGVACNAGQQTKAPPPKPTELQGSYRRG